MSSTIKATMFENLSENELDELVSQYVHNGLTPEQMETFEFEMLDNEEVLAKVELAMQMEIAFSDSLEGLESIEPITPSFVVRAKQFLSQPIVGGALLTYSFCLTMFASFLYPQDYPVGDAQIMGFSTAPTRNSFLSPSIEVDDSLEPRVILFRLGSLPSNDFSTLRIRLTHQASDSEWLSESFARKIAHTYTIVLPTSLALGKHDLEVLAVKDSGDYLPVVFCHYLESDCEN